MRLSSQSRDRSLRARENALITFGNVFHPRHKFDISMVDRRIGKSEAPSRGFLNSPTLAVCVMLTPKRFLVEDAHRGGAVLNALTHDVDFEETQMGSVRMV